MGAERGLIIQAANGALADYAVESRARPPGVNPALQTTSERARAAIADQLESHRLAVHHLVPANVWKDNIDLARLAFEAGWRVDAPSNLIALPMDETVQRELGDTLPIHNRRHDIYSKNTNSLIDFARQAFPGSALTPDKARAILDWVALYNRGLIIARVYHPIIKTVN
jgi:hypothetical protein